MAGLRARISSPSHRSRGLRQEIRLARMLGRSMPSGHAARISSSRRTGRPKLSTRTAARSLLGRKVDGPQTHPQHPHAVELGCPMTMLEGPKGQLLKSEPHLPLVSGAPHPVLAAVAAPRWVSSIVHHHYALDAGVLQLRQPSPPAGRLDDPGAADRLALGSVHVWQKRRCRKRGPMEGATMVARAGQTLCGQRRCS